MKRKDSVAVRAAEERVLAMFPRAVERINQLAGNLSAANSRCSRSARPHPRSEVVVDRRAVARSGADRRRSADRRGAPIHEAPHDRRGGAVRERRAAAGRARRSWRRRVPVLGSDGRVARPAGHPAVGVHPGAGAGGPEPAAPKPKARARRRAARALGRGEQLRAAPAADAPVVLECAGVTKRFGGHHRRRRRRPATARGPILGLIGQKRAGKTTLFDCVSGFLRVDGGRIRLRGRDITDLRPTNAPRSASAARSKRRGCSRR